MKLTKNLKLSLNALLLNKVRTMFAVIGLSIGIATVIVIVSIANGADKKLNEQYVKTGANLIAINSCKTAKVIGRERQTNIAATLTVKDAAALVEECPYIDKAVPTADTYVKIKYLNSSTMAMVEGGLI